MNSSVLSSPIEYLKGVGPQRADVLKKELHIFSFGDLLLHFPFRYEDRTSFYSINQITADTQTVQLKGKIIDFEILGTGTAKRLAATFADKTGEIELIWFRSISWMEKNLKVGTEYIVFGKPNLFRQKFSIAHPEISTIEEEEKGVSGKLHPVYSTTEKLKIKNLDSKGISRLVKTLFSFLKENDVEEILPSSIISKYKFDSRFKAFHEIHFPQNETQLSRATKRLKYEEFFLIQIQLLLIKKSRKTNSAGFIFSHLGDFFNRFYKEKLPFELTGAQKRVIKEIRSDFLNGKQMNRLLQGDVGSGKTVVALTCMLMANDNGFQSCIMAPTEILVQQHFQSLKDLTNGIGVNVELLTAAVKGKERKKLFENLANGEIHILVGTHALIEDDVRFKNLGLAVIDEQHRFGVEQRAKLWRKNNPPPHILVMTATPIPRTLAMTLYGDLDVSVIDEMPPGRKLIKTISRFESSRLQVFGFLKKQIAEGRQIYIVFPLIEESEKLDFKNLMEGYEAVTRSFPLPDYAVSIVHGRMKPEAKNWEMNRFVNGETNIMVATTVIEVGVNVPNASVMIVESAERFGLSQLHQLRGRVGRGADQSFCILMTGNKLSGEARRRMETMCSTNDGFEIAEVDLELRGPGDLAGTQQSGVLNLHIASISKDRKILEAARADAEIILEKDRLLLSAENKSLLNFISEKTISGQQWGKIS